MAMTNTAEGSPEPVHKRSGWLVPLAVFLVTAGLSGAVLYYYLGPSPPGFIRDTPSPTTSTEPVNLTVNGAAFVIPANYLVYRQAQKGGAQSDVALFALLPDLSGYSAEDAQRLASNAPDSPALYLLLRADRLNLTEADRLARIYMGYVSNRLGVPGPFGLVQYSFRDDSGYRGEDLFVGQLGSGMAVFRCVRFSAEVPSPSCLRETPLIPGVALSYRFKRAHLAQWREISTDAERLVRDFLKTGQPRRGLPEPGANPFPESPY